MGVPSRRLNYWREEGRGIEDRVAAGLGAGRVYEDKHLVVTRTLAPVGLRFVGEIDLNNASAVGKSLDAAFGDAGDVHLDLSGLLFCDISGVRALLEAAETLRAGRRLLLHGLPPQLQTVMRVTGWVDLPALGICPCREVAL